ncbi:DUF2203 family protein [Fictibacillus aquaticus]|uniref:DUF2203 family protein n=1 Tax=Fictibacillus aquaticus TaxID=2021314 RepID=A0A235FCL2_9BACL|nr:DUF2203 family protein [Fictibacillus aquaticus]OYD58673.1 hypothetical protein CGZ90_01875 [Fictibacillus aquaticus]
MKVFTLEEANQLLPVISRELETLENIQYLFEKDYEEFQGMQLYLTEDDAEYWEEHFRVMEMQAEHCIHNILSFGVLFEDLEAAVIRFPAIFNGKEGFFRWTPDEPTVMSYLENSKETEECVSLIN